MDKKDLHRIVATAIIVKEENPSQPPFEKGRRIANAKGGRKYLILKRSPQKKVYPNKWTVPGGGLELDDYISEPKTTKDAWYFVVDKFLRREIKEECNLEVGQLNYLCDLVFIRPDDIPVIAGGTPDISSGTPVITLSYWAEYLSGEIELDEDHTEYFWGTLDELKDYDLIEGIYDEIKMVEEILCRKKSKKKYF